MHDTYLQYFESLSKHDQLFDLRGNVEQEIAYFQVHGYHVPQQLFRQLDHYTSEIAALGEPSETTIPEPEFQDIEIVIRDATCKHSEIIIEDFGSRWFDGEVMDDLRMTVRCADCGKIFCGKEDDGNSL
jgi:hypothetical protein